MADMWSDIDRVAPLANEGHDPRGQGSRPRPRPRPGSSRPRPRPRPGASRPRPRPRTYIFVLEDPRGQKCMSLALALASRLQALALALASRIQALALALASSLGLEGHDLRWPRGLFI